MRGLSGSAALKRWGNYRRHATTHMVNIGSASRIDPNRAGGESIGSVRRTAGPESSSVVALDESTDAFCLSANLAKIVDECIPNFQ
jgi:hypothetical protein